MPGSQLFPSKNDDVSLPLRIAQEWRRLARLVANAQAVLGQATESRPGLTRAVLVLFVILVPLIVQNDYYLRVIDMILLYSVLCIGLNLVIGQTGLVSFGHAAFYGIGAYTTAILMKNHGWPFLAAFLLSGVLAALFGALLGLPSARVSGDYLCAVTLAFGEIVYLVFLNWTDVTRGPMGIPGMPAARIGSFTLSSHAHYYYFGLLLLALTYWVARNIQNSKIGRAFLAIREDELAASLMGINTFYYKVLCLVVATFFAGLAGSYLAVYLSFVGPQSFTIDESVLMLIMVIWGGLGSLPGSIFGAATMLLVVEVFRPLFKFRMLIWGLVLLVVLLVRPQGVLPRRPYRPRWHSPRPGGDP